MRLFLAASAAFLTFTAAAAAAPMTIGGVNFDSANAATDVRWAQGGVTTGPPANRREACDNAGNPNTGATGVECRAVEANGFDLTTSVELDFNGTAPDDVLSVLFGNPILNGAGSCLASANAGNGPANAAAYAGCDLVIFEILNQPDVPTLALSLADTNSNTEILGVLLASITDINPNQIGQQSVAIWGFDLTGLGIALGASAPNPLYVGNRQFGVDFSGSPDIAAIVALNVGAPVVPLPAALPLFFAGLAGLGFAARNKKTK